MTGVPCVQVRLISLRASLGMKGGPDADAGSPQASVAIRRQHPSEVSAGEVKGGFTLGGACDLLHLLLYSLDRLAAVHDKGPGEGSPSQTALAPAAADELEAARFTVQTLLEELGACVAAQTAGAPSALDAEPARAEHIQRVDAGTAPEAFGQQTAEQGTQTEVDQQHVFMAQAAQTDADASGGLVTELDQQRARAKKWKTRCKKVREDVAAAQAAEKEATAVSRAQKAALELRMADMEAACAPHENRSASAITRQQDSSMQQARAAGAEQSQSEVRDSLAAINADLRAALAAQLSGAEGERRSLSDQIAAAEVGRRATAEQAEVLSSQLKAAQEQHATLEAALHAEKDRAEALQAGLRVETDKVASLEAGLRTERAKLDRARIAVLHTVDTLKKASEGSMRRLQLEAVAQRVEALKHALREAREKLAQRRKQLHTLRESHAQAMAGLQQTADAAEATASELRLQLTEAVQRHEMSQQQQDAAGAEISQMRALFEEAAQRHEHTQRELKVATDALAATASLAAGAAALDGASGVTAFVPDGAAVAELAQQADRAVGKLLRRCSALEATLRLVERDRDRAHGEAIEVYETARHAEEEIQAARASEAAALAACEAMELSIQQLRRQHELESLAAGERHAAEMRGWDAAMVDSRAALKQRDAEDAADALAAAQAAADAARADEVAATRQHHDAELAACQAQHAAQLDKLKAQLAAAEAARDSVREHFGRYQAQRAHEVAVLEDRLRAAMRQHWAPAPPPPTGSNTLAAVKGQVRRSARTICGKNGKAAKSARRAPLRPSNCQKENGVDVQTSPKPAKPAPGT